MKAYDCVVATLGTVAAVVGLTAYPMVSWWVRAPICFAMGAYFVSALTRSAP